MGSSAIASDIDAWQRDAELALNRREFERAHELCLRILGADPGHAHALFLLAMIAAEHGNFRKALEVVDRALAIDAARPAYFAQRGRCLIALHRPREGFESAQSALALGPRDALTLDTIGVVLTRAGAHAEALAPFRRAVELDASKPAYLYNLGASEQFVGDFERAAAAYRRALELDPKYHRAWSALAQVEKAPFSADEVAQIERQLAAAPSEDAELHLCHALAKQAEDLGRYAEAFRYLERGKRRKRAARVQPFAAHEALFAAATRTAPLAAAPGGFESAEPIFIVGMPRTGTTLVERILSSHPAVFAAGELTNFSLALKRATATPSNRVLDPETLDAAGRVGAHALGAAYVDSTRPRTGHTARFIDKMPLNFFYAALIHRALPNARIICMRRNALDTCLSNYRQLFATTFAYYDYSFDLLDTGRYYVAFDALARLWRESIPSNYCEVRYEDVVEHTEREARRLIDFCGLDWDPRCLAFAENTSPVATASSIQVRQPIYRTAVARWRNYETELEPLRRLLADAGVL
ncbi:MAG TPA: sulfotransferase [Gammaproteobacteria bacterium]|nr:sulfotransferase [Gammaproteobacteria bacterium]